MSHTCRSYPSGPSTHHDGNQNVPITSMATSQFNLDSLNAGRRSNSEANMATTERKPWQEFLTFDPFLNTFPLHGDPKLHPQQIECASLRSAFKPTQAPSSAALFQYRKPASISNKEAPTPSPKIISISGAKNEPKTSSCACLSWSLQSFPSCSVDFFSVQRIHGFRQVVQHV